MSKFENSYYNTIWKSREGRKVVEMILADPNLIKINPSFYAKYFKIDPQICPTNAKGEATFISEMREQDHGGLMDMRAPLSDTLTADKKGIAHYSDTIPEFSARGFYEKATERMYKEKMFEQFGDTALIAQYATDEIQRMINSAQQTLSYMGAMLLSTGNIIYKKGEGIQGAVIKAPIPEANRDTAGVKAWSDPDCNILSQMIAKQDKYKDLFGIEGGFVWQITKEQFQNVFMKNKQVLEWIRYVGVINNTPLPESFVATEEMTVKALAQYNGLAPIVIDSELSYDYGTGTFVKGWKEGIAIYRPAGFAGMIRRAEILDETAFAKYGNSVNIYNFTKTLGGLATIMNSVTVNGNFKEWHTDLFVKAVPTLDQFLYHVIIDTTQADA